MKKKKEETKKPPEKRLIKRGQLFMRRMVERRSSVLRQIALDWKEEMGFWRWLKNENIDWKWLSEQAWSASQGDEAVRNRHVLSVQDGSTISFQGWIGRKKGLGVVGTTGNQPGFLIHPSLLLDADDGRCVGLGELAVYDPWVAAGEAEQVRHLEADEKKTGSWLTVGKQVRQRLGCAKQVTHVADREADFYEMLVEFSQHRQANEHLIVRVNEDRLLGQMQGRGKARWGGQPDEQVQTGHGIQIDFPYRSALSKLVERLPVQAHWTLHLPATPKRAARHATVALRYARQVPIRRPTNLYQRTY